MPKTCWFCVDLEASGPVPGLYSMLSLGATVVRPGPTGWTLGEDHYVEFKPLPDAGADPGAMAVHGLDLETLSREGREPRTALEELNAWVDQQRDGLRPVFVGHNAPFDWSYVNWYYVRFDVPNPFGYKALDTKALAMGVFGLDWFETHKERLAELLPDLPPEDKGTKHRADYDARYQAEILRGLLKHMGL